MKDGVLTEFDILERRAAAMVFDHLRNAREGELVRLRAIRDALALRVKMGQAEPWGVEVVP